MLLSTFFGDFRFLSLDLLLLLDEGRDQLFLLFSTEIAAVDAAAAAADAAATAVAEVAALAVVGEAVEAVVAVVDDNFLGEEG